jgi:hypothetical protein
VRHALLVHLACSGLFVLRAAAQTVISEDFAANPLDHGWQMLGDTNLFQWDSTNQDLRVTWDSAQPNSSLYHPLGTILTRADDFSLVFDLRLDTIGPGLDPAKSATFQIAVGFLNVNEFGQASFLRGTGSNSPDLVELDYFWDSGFGATVWPAVVSTNASFNYNSAKDYALFSLALGDWYRIQMAYAASNQTLVTTVTNFEGTAGVLISTLVNTNFTDFRVTSLSITSYSDAGQTPAFAGSVLAHGVIDNLAATVPDPPIQNATGGFQNGTWQFDFLSRPDWLYTLERTVDFQTWTPLLPSTPGGAGDLRLTDASPPQPAAFYRVRAERPSRSE